MKIYVKLFYKYNYFCVICINSLSFKSSLKFFLDSEDVFKVKQHRSMMFHVSGVQFGASRTCLLER